MYKHTGTSKMRKYVLYTAVSLSALGSLQLAYAQDNDTEATEQVIVTGVRQKGVKAKDSAEPVVILDRKAIESVGQQNLVAVLQQNIPSYTAQSLGGDAGNFTLEATLRGLSPNHTLILVDGKRLHPTANLQASPGSGLYQGAAGADLNLIPLDSIDHVEVLQDGAAAQYGTDAIAGVINIILKKDCSGGDFSGSVGQYYKSDGKSGDAQFHKAIDLNGRGFINVTGEARFHGRSQIGGADYRIQNPDGSLRSDISAQNAAGIAANSKYPNVNRSLGDAQSRLYNFMYNSAYEISETAKFYSFGSFGYRQSSSYENYRLPDAVTTRSSGVETLLYPTGFSPLLTSEGMDYSVTAGISGHVQDWSWDISSTYGGNTSKMWTERSANASLYADTGSTPSKFYDGVFRSSQWTNNIDITRRIKTIFPSPLNIAFGAEVRRETYGIGKGDAASTYKEGGQGYPGFQQSDVGSYSRMNVAGYADISTHVVPKLFVDVAGRVEHFSDFGTTAIGKLTMRYDFNKSIALRGTVSTGFRAPTLAEEHYSSTTLTPTYAIVQLPVNSAAAASAGFSPLKPESSESFSFGSIITPIDRMHITVDIYQTNIDHRIMSSGYLLGQLGNTVVSQGVLDAISQHGNVLGSGMSYVAMSVFTNAANTRTRGLDVNLDYDTTFAKNWKANWSLGANINKTDVRSQAALPAGVYSAAYNQTALLGPVSLSTIENATPRWRLTPAINLTHNRLSINIRENIYGPVSSLASWDSSNVDVINIKSAVTAITDLDIKYRVLKNLTISIGASNIFNKHPTKVRTVTDSSGQKIPANGMYTYNSPILYSPYGINGGYYYATARVTF